MKTHRRRLKGKIKNALMIAPAALIGYLPQNARAQSQSGLQIPIQKVEQVESLVTPDTINIARYVPAEIKPASYSLLSANGLKVSLEDSLLIFRPFGTFNYQDNGLANAKFKVTPQNTDEFTEGNAIVYSSEREWKEKSPDFNLDRIVNFADFLAFVAAFRTSSSRHDLTGDGFVNFQDFLEFVNYFGRYIEIRNPDLEGQLEVEIEKNLDFERHYGLLSRGGRYWSAPFDSAAIFTGHSRQPGENSFREVSGPKPTETQIEWAKTALTETVYKLSRGFFKKDIKFILTDNSEEFLDLILNKKCPVYFYWDNTLSGDPRYAGQTGLLPATEQEIKQVSISVTTESDEATYNHEASNLTGMSDARDEDTWSITSRFTKVIQPDILDIAVGTAYYDKFR